LGPNKRCNSVIFRSVAFATKARKHFSDFLFRLLRFQTFKAKEPLSAVRLYVQVSQRTSDFWVGVGDDRRMHRLSFAL
jgi:hypothetical protein